MNGLTNLSAPDDWLKNWLSGVELNDAGDPLTTRSRPINADNIISTAPAWYAINKIVGHVGQLPCNVHIGDSQKKDKNHDGHWLMRTEPNAFQTPIIFKETVQAHALLWGNGRAYIHRNSRTAKPLELVPLMPDRTATFMFEGEKWHVSQPHKNDRLELLETPDDNNTVVMRDRDVLHIPGFGFNGIYGKSLMEVARDSFRIGIDGTKRSAQQMRKGFTGKVMLEAPRGVFRNEEDAKEFFENFKDEHTAEGKGADLGMLREGMTAKVMQMSNKDAEFVEQRKLAREEAALWFCIESILGIDGVDSYNSLEQRNLAYLSTCLGRWIVKWEEELSRKLLTQVQRRRQSRYFRFNIASILRSDMQTTINSLGNALVHRIMNPNEARKKLDMDPYEGGDRFCNPAIDPVIDEFTKAQGEGDSADDSANSKELTPAEAVQKVYLGVGKVVTSDEARDIVNKQSGADLAVPGPEFEAIQSQSPMQARLGHLMKVEQRTIQSKMDAGKSFENIRQWYSTWETKLGDVIEKEFGGDRSIASEHCKSSLAYLAKGAATFSLEGSAELIIQEIEEMTSEVLV